MYKLICRGQVTPAAQTVVYEVFVEEVSDGPIPTLYADLLCTVDGLPAFHCRRMGLRLVPDFPLGSRPALLAGHELADPQPQRAAATLGHRYDAASIAACAWGAPSAAFGERFARFDGPQRCPRLPGPPYLFMTRVTEVNDPATTLGGTPAAGGSITAEYQIPPDAWYFGENGCRTMPYAVLLEAALQPCGWFASYKGSVLQAAEELYFRNLDGTATQYREVFPEDGVLRTQVTNTSLARLGTMTIVGFEVNCFVGETRVFGMTTTFGFFPKAALAAQAGLPADDARRAQLQEASTFRRELGPRPPRYCGGHLALPGPMLLLLDRVTGFWPQGGAAGLGRLRAEIDVDAQDWFFQSHFMGDSVQPGSLGLEAMLQALQFYMIERELGTGIAGARFEPVQIDAPMTWKYRGQVMPAAARVTVELEITATGGDGVQEAYALAAASLWVDGLRIYEATNVGMRIVADPQAAHTAGDEVLDPRVDTWLNDHCPTWTIPALAMMSMADRLGAGAAVRAPGRKVIGLRNVRVQRWLSFGAGARTLRVVGTPHGSDTVSMQLLAYERARDSFQAIAAGDVVVAEHWPLPPGAWPSVLERQPGLQPEPDPYAAGVLFHGPAYQLLTELWSDGAGASYWLDLAASGVPVGYLNQGLLDAATHGIPHDALWRWSEEIPRDVAAYPVALTAAFYGPTPTGGRLRCEARFGGFRGGDRKFPIVHVQIIRDQVVWAELELVEMLLPKGPLGEADPQARRAFLADRQYVPGVALGEFDGEATRLASAQVKASDWLPGTVAAIYGVDDSDPAQLARGVAIREHAARRLAVHPSAVIAEEMPSAGEESSGADNEDRTAGEQTAPLVRAAAAQRPYNPYLLQVARNGDGWQVREALSGVEGEGRGALDVSRVRAYWRAQANSEDTLVEDLTLALLRRFVRTIEVVDPAGFAAVQGRGVLYLANHQLDIESVLFVAAIASLQGTVTTAIARQELHESWVGPFHDICFRHPQIRDMNMLLLIDRGSPEAVWQALAAAVEGARTRRNSLLVHVEGKHAVRAGQPVEVLSTALVDLAVSNDVPIVPLRFTGGLPRDPVAAPLAFPAGYGKQDFRLGTPILPEVLAPLASAARRELVLGSINGLTGRAGGEQPHGGDAHFAAQVAAWQAAQGVSEVQAALWCALEEVTQPSRETQVLRASVQGARRDKQGIAKPRREWLARAAGELFGLKLR
jgi:3-hydroxymyristoyl/3-hydroxydecanoyl-(acyl carrier protein) dehydratase